VALFPRLIGLEAPKIPVHAFMADLGEWERGKRTRQNVIDAFGVAQAEEADLDALAAKLKVPLEGYPLSGRVTLTNVGTAYDANNDSLSLPFVYIQRGGVTRIDVEARVRKVGTGTQHWQLWDDTNGVAVVDTDTPTANTTGSLSDAGAAADRTLNASRTFPTALSPQVVKLRFRCRSTTGADDPIFLNAAILIFRVDVLTAVQLHEVLLLAEAGLAYTTEAALKARLGLA
jgi:hypothetical protein